MKIYEVIWVKMTIERNSFSYPEKHCLFDIFYVLKLNKHFKVLLA